jgi:hypothetical protein
LGSAEFFLEFKSLNSNLGGQVSTQEIIFKFV